MWACFPPEALREALQFLVSEHFTSAFEKTLKGKAA
jgi:hypothetical protein